MRSKPTRIVSWTARWGGVFSFLAGVGATRLATAGDLDEPTALITGHWPWIAVAMIFGLLGVVAYLSRRRIHSVVGS
jgi:hypothetical protein